MKRIILVLLALTVLSGLALSVSAESTETWLIHLDNTKDIVITVTWETEQPSIVFIAPDRTEFDPTAEKAGTAVMISGKTMYYLIEQASAGQWLVRYDKGTNEKLDISVADYKTGPVVKSFALGTLEDDKLPVSFRIEGPEAQNYQYRLSAVVDYSGAEIELRTGSSRTYRDESVTLSLSGLTSYDAYMIKLYVWYTRDEADIFNFAYSAPFSYTNTSKDQYLPAMTVTVQPEDSLLYVSWDEPDWRVESALIALFEDGAEEPVTYDTYEPKAGSVQLGYTPSAATVDVEFSVRVDGISTTPVRKTFSPADMAITVPEGTSFNTLTLPVQYQGLTDQLVELTVNGYTSTYILSGDGTLNATLGDGWNQFSLCYTDGQGIVWQICRDIYVDRDAPVLTMSQEYDGMVLTSTALTVSGTALDCSTVTVNGEAVTLAQDGSFSHGLTLNSGENIITVVAADPLGNEAHYTAKVCSGQVNDQSAQSDQSGTDSAQTSIGLVDLIGTKGSYWALLVSGVLCLLVVLYGLIFWRREEKK